MPADTADDEQQLLADGTQSGSVPTWRTRRVAIVGVLLGAGVALGACVALEGCKVKPPLGAGAPMLGEAAPTCDSDDPCCQCDATKMVAMTPDDSTMAGVGNAVNMGFKVLANTLDVFGAGVAGNLYWIGASVTDGIQGFNNDAAWNVYYLQKAFQDMEDYLVCMMRQIVGDYFEEYMGEENLHDYNMALDGMTSWWYTKCAERKCLNYTDKAGNQRGTCCGYHVDTEKAKRQCKKFSMSEIEAGKAPCTLGDGNDMHYQGRCGTDYVCYACSEYAVMRGYGNYLLEQYETSPALAWGAALDDYRNIDAISAYSKGTGFVLMIYQYLLLLGQPGAIDEQIYSFAQNAAKWLEPRINDLTDPTKIAEQVETNSYFIEWDDVFKLEDQEGYPRRRRRRYSETVRKTDEQKGRTGPAYSIRTGCTPSTLKHYVRVATLGDDNSKEARNFCADDKCGKSDNSEWTPTDNKCEITFYEHKDYGGQAWSYKEDVSYVGDGNDKFSSVKIPKGCPPVIAYENSDYKGYWQMYYEDVPNIDDIPNVEGDGRRRRRCGMTDGGRRRWGACSSPRRRYFADYRDYDFNDKISSLRVWTDQRIVSKEGCVCEAIQWYFDPNYQASKGLSYWQDVYAVTAMPSYSAYNGYNQEDRSYSDGPNQCPYGISDSKPYGYCGASWSKESGVTGLVTDGIGRQDGIQFQYVGNGWCVDKSGNRIGNSMADATATVVRNNGADACESQCAKDTNCIGYMTEDSARCAVILSSDPNAASGISGHDTETRNTCWSKIVQISCDLAIADGDIDQVIYNSENLTTSSLEESGSGKYKLKIDKPYPSAYLVLSVTGSTSTTLTVSCDNNVDASSYSYMPYQRWETYETDQPAYGSPSVIDSCHAKGYCTGWKASETTTASNGETALKAQKPYASFRMDLTPSSVRTYDVAKHHAVAEVLASNYYLLENATKFLWTLTNLSSDGNRKIDTDTWLNFYQNNGMYPLPYCSNDATPGNKVGGD